MRVYNYSEARQQLTSVLNRALKEDVVISRRDGTRFLVRSIKKNVRLKKSPFESIATIKVKATTKDIVDVIREGREGL